MSGRRTGNRYRAGTFAVLGFIASGLAIPLMVGKGGDGTGASSAAVYDSYRISSPIDISSAPHLSLTAGTVSLAMGSRHTARDLTAIMGDRGIRLELQDPVFVIAPGAAASPPDAAVILAPLVTALAHLSFEALAIRNGTLKFGSEPSAATLEHIDADIMVPGFATAQASGAFDFRAQRITFEVTTGPGEPRHHDVHAVKARVDSPLFTGNLEGNLTLGGTPRLSAAHATISMPNLRQTANWLGVPWGLGGGLGNFTAEGALEWESLTVAFQDSRFKLDANEATGGLSLMFGGRVPALEGTLAFKTLKLDPYLPVAPASDRPAWFSNMLAMEIGRNSMPALEGVDADIRVSADQLTVGEMSFRRGAAALSLTGGRLNADVAELTFAEDSRASGQISAQIVDGEPHYGIRAKLIGVDLAAASQALFDGPVLRGRGDAALDLTAAGAGLKEIIASLCGKAAVNLPKGGEFGFDAGALRGDTRTGVSIGLAGSTPIDGLEGRMRVADGIWTIDKLTAQAGRTELSATGQVVTATRALDLVVRRRPNLATEGPAGLAVAPSLGGGVVVQGPWDHPVFRAEAKDGAVVPAASPAGPAPL